MHEQDPFHRSRRRAHRRAGRRTDRLLREIPPHRWRDPGLDPAARRRLRIRHGVQPGRAGHRELPAGRLRRAAALAAADTGLPGHPLPRGADRRALPRGQLAESQTWHRAGAALPARSQHRPRCQRDGGRPRNRHAVRRQPRRPRISVGQGLRGLERCRPRAGRCAPHRQHRTADQGNPDQGERGPGSRRRPRGADRSRFLRPYA